MAGPDTDRWPAIGEPPRSGGPVLPGVADADPRADRDPVGRDRVGRIGRVALQSQRARRVAQVDAGPRRSMPNAAADQPGPGGETGIGRPSRRRRAAGGTLGGPSRASAPVHREPVGPHAVEPDERFDGADQHRGRSPGRLDDHVQAVVHPVDKVHVGDARWSRHDPIAGRRAEAGVRGQVLRPTVGLDLDDARLTAPGVVVADQPDTQQGRPDDSGRTGQRCSVEDAQAGWLGNQTSIESGMKRPKIEKKRGIRVVWKTSTIADVSSAVPDLAQAVELLGVLGDARDQEERAEDHDHRTKDQAGLDDPEQAAKDLVGETRLREQRLRLVEALRDEGEGDRGGDEDRAEADHVGVLPRELRPVIGEEVAQRLRQRRGEQEREQDRCDTDQSADRALGEPKHEKAHEEQDE